MMTNPITCLWLMPFVLTSALCGAAPPVSGDLPLPDPAGLYKPSPTIGYVSPPVPIPGNAYERPEQIYVLPVIVAPQGDERWLPDPATPGLNLNGEPFVGAPHAGADSFPVQYARVENNLSVHLQTARIMYENMLRNPLSGVKRGTFALAQWDAQAGIVRKVVSKNQVVKPLVMALQNFDRSAVVALHGAQPLPTPYWVEEIFARLGCQRMTCPFVLAITMVGNPFNPVHGAKWNYGYNNGGGAAYFNYSTVLKSWDTNPAAGHNFLSTLVHEVGHAFGLPHINDYCNVAPNCNLIARLNQSSSGSIMSYNLANRIYGCVRTSAANQTHCLLPAAREIDGLPGTLEVEDKRVLDANALAIPAFDFMAALDHVFATDEVFALNANGDWDVTVADRFHVESADSHPNTVSPPILIGGFSEHFLEVEESNFLRTWASSVGAFGSWAEYHIYLPEAVTLQRVRVYGGHDGDNDRPTGLQLFAAGDPNPIASGYNLFGANHDLVTQRSGNHFILQMQRGASGIARLRGLRLFGRPAGRSHTVELYPPAEPVATTGFGSTFGGDIANVVGSDQQVAGAALPFVAHASWHSSVRPAGSWVSIDLALPRETTLRGMSVQTGHTSGVHAATQIQIERECVCRHPYDGAGAVCQSQSIAACSAAGGVGQRVYEVVTWEPSATADDYVGLGDATAERWRVALKTAPGTAGTDRWMVVRALRLWSGEERDAFELFPPRAYINQ